MRFPLTDDVLDEAKRFSMRSACPDCFFFVERTGACAHEWPNEEQRVAIDAVAADGQRPESVSLCKEFELR